MEYRNLGKTGLEVSRTGLGTEYLSGQSGAAINEVLHAAVEGGVNYIDLLWDNPDGWKNFEPVFKQYRDRFVVAAHWGSDQNRMDLAQHNFDAILSRLCHDHAEVGLVSMIDTDVKWNGYAQIALECLQKYKKRGMIGAIGASSHFVPSSLKMVASGMIDVLMVPINLFRHHTEGNEALQQACAEHGVGLVAMKPYAGGQIFVKTPPITPIQALAYVLSRPISTAVIGVKNREELNAALHYWVADDGAKNFQSVLDTIHDYLVGDCVYCNHCLPCPQEINIGQMIHMADVAQYFPRVEALAEYARLAVKASDCMECGDCMERCPFEVDVVARMRYAAQYYELQN